MLADAVGHREAGAAVHEALAADGGARDAVAAALSALDGAAAVPQRRRPPAPRLLAELDDVVAELRDVAEAIEEDPEQLAAVRARRQQLRDLCRKYGDDLAEVLAYEQEAATRLAELEGHEERAAVIDAEHRDAVAAERKAAAKVGRQRRAAAGRSARPSRRGCASWRCPTPPSTVELDDDPAGEHVQFLLAANPGSPALPVAKAASGGELARTMLALRLVLTAPGDGRPHARVRRGRRRHRRDRGDGRGSRPRRGRPDAPGASSSPTSPRSPPRRRPRSPSRSAPTARRPPRPRRS